MFFKILIPWPPHPVIPTATLRTPGQQELSIAQSPPEVSHVGVREQGRHSNRKQWGQESRANWARPGWGLGGGRPLQEGLGFQKQGAEVGGGARERLGTA